MNKGDGKKIIILCGPSGSGKTTVAKHLLKTIPELEFSISATTRQKREQEEHSKDYYFLSIEEFTSLISEGQLVEYEEVYKGAFYGTLKSEIVRIWDLHKIPLLDIDVIGALNIKEHYAPEALSIFVHPVSLENIQKRLQKRATESEESLIKRTQRAAEELKMAEMFDRIVYNDDLEKACDSAEQYIREYLISANKIKI
jgi:guanylate kinase